MCDYFSHKIIFFRSMKKLFAISEPFSTIAVGFIGAGLFLGRLSFFSYLSAIKNKCQAL